MKIKITKDTVSPLQDAFSVAPDFAQKVEGEKLLIMEKILERMELLKMKRKDLAAAMEVSPARITAMLDGKNNFKLETLMRAAEALGCEFQTCFKPKSAFQAEMSDGTIVQHYDFVPNPREVKQDKTGFSEKTVAENDEVDAA